MESTAMLTGLAAAEVRERRLAEEERIEIERITDRAREELPSDGVPIPLQEYLFAVSRSARVDLLDAKRALSRLRHFGEADYRFGVGVSRRN